MLTIKTMTPSKITGNHERRVQFLAWLLAGGVTTLALTVWASSRSFSHFTGYDFFPLLGLLAFGLMWTHYVVGSIRRFYRVKRTVLRGYFQITGAAALLLILLHPAISSLLLFFDGFGIPPFSYFAVYSSPGQMIGLTCGMVAIIAFLSYELHRWFRSARWWRYVEYANIAAMGLILLHAFLLGGELGVGWFMMVWYGYAITLAGAIVFNASYDKKRGHYE